MTDDHELVGLDPFNILDQEAGRLDAFLNPLRRGMVTSNPV